MGNEDSKAHCQERNRAHGSLTTTAFFEQHTLTLRVRHRWQPVLDFLWWSREVAFTDGVLAALPVVDPSE